MPATTPTPDPTAVAAAPVQLVPISDLVPHPQNPNEGDIGAIAESLRVNGWYGTVVANRSTRHILAGNHRVRAAAMLGYTELPVFWVDIPPADELRVLLADNRTTRLGIDNDALLAQLLQDLAAAPAGLAGSGYDGDDLDELLADLERDQGTRELNPVEKAEAYEAREVSQIILVYPLAQYSRVTAALNEKREALGLDSFSAVVAHLLGVPE